MNEQFNIRPWSADIGNDKITHDFLKNFSGSFYDNLRPQEFYFWCESNEKFGFEKHVIICPIDYCSYNCGHWWDQNISDFISHLNIEGLDLQEQEACFFTTKQSLNDIRMILKNVGMTEYKDLQL